MTELLYNGIYSKTELNSALQFGYQSRNVIRRTKMKDGFIRVAAATPDLKVADPVFNREQTWKMMQEAASQDVKILVFPELGLTGYTCSDLFLQDTLIDQAKEELLWLLDASKDMDMLTFTRLQWMKDG